MHIKEKWCLVLYSTVVSIHLLCCPMGWRQLCLLTICQSVCSLVCKVFSVTITHKPLDRFRWNCRYTLSTTGKETFGRWLTEYNVYTKPMLVHKFVLDWEFETFTSNILFSLGSYDKVSEVTINHCMLMDMARNYQLFTS